MEIEPSSPAMAKKLWNIMRVVFYMLRKGISKSKLFVDFHMLLKRGNKIAGKALGNLMLLHHHHRQHHFSAGFTGRSKDVASSFVGPREYEFSCSNTPLYFPYYSSKRKNHGHHYNDRRRRHFDQDDEIEVDDNVVREAFEILSSYDTAEEASPMVLPGFGTGKSPAVRQLRITDSPFPLKDSESEDSAQVNKAADEFIKKFYKELRRQMRTAALESPSPYHTWAR